MDPQTAFADALARARQIAAKIGEKRPFSDEEDDFPDSKRMAGGDSMSPQLRASAAAIAAANAAAQINAKLGLAGSGSAPVNPMAGLTSMAGLSSMGFSTTEIVEVPDKMVGLVIGKGGEHISMIQNGSGVKVQFAPDSGGMPNRQCTLSGTKEGIVKAKQMIQDILSRGHAVPPSDGPFRGGGGGMGGGLGGGSTVEMYVPGPRVGLVIGKNGEMIKHIQEKCGVKVVIIQDSNRPSDEDKPLRITGDPEKCQRAKEMVMDLLAQKDGEAGGFGGGEYGAGRRGGSMEVPVPRTLVGVIIGRNGEVIKRISADTGTKVQFKNDDGTGPERQCSIVGPPDGVQRAAQIVRELVQNAARQDGGRANGGGPYGGGGQDATYVIPADKCGLVIGKGGETIREINSRSGARAELSRNENPSSAQRTFNIKGSPEQIQEAIRLICEKAGLPPPADGPQGGPGGPHGGPGYGGLPYGGPGPYGYPGSMPQGGPMGYPHPGGWSGQHPQHPQQPWAPPASDPSKGQGQPGQDPMSAAWAAYYQSVYGGQQQQPGNGVPQQPGQQQAAQQQQNPYGAPQQQQQSQPGQQQPATGQQQQQAAAGQQQGYSYSAPTVNPQTGQMDYSAAWAEYYRQQGMYQQAQAITQQQQHPNGGAGQQSQPPLPH